MIKNNSHVGALIVGAGAAGMTCALYLARAGITTIVLDHGRSILRRAELHNFPGLGPTLGYDWLDSLRDAVNATTHTTFESTRVTSLGLNEDAFFADAEGSRHHGDYLVLATGQGSFDYAALLGVATTAPVQPHVRTNVVIDRWGETTVPNVFACGVLAGWPSQAVVCAGSGANAAVRIASRVKGGFWVDHDSAPVRTAAGSEE